MWNKALLKVAFAKSAGICCISWRRHWKRHLEMMVRFTISDIESKYKLKIPFSQHFTYPLCVS